jgi:hypothetical protein
MRSNNCLLIDDGGSILDSRSPQLRAALHGLHLGEHFVDYAIRNLGFIAAIESGTAVQLRLRPAVVSQHAMCGLLYWLGDRRPERVMLATLDAGGWNHTMLGNGATAATRLARLVAKAQSPRRDDFLVEALDLGSLPAQHALRDLVAARAELEAALDRCDYQALAAILEPRIGSRYSVSVTPGEQRRFVVAHVGRGFEKRARYWMSRIVGHRLEDLPDPDYGTWAAETYTAIAERNEPAVDDVDAIVVWPGEGRKRYRYRRLLLPLRRGDGAIAVLSATISNRAIDLRASRGEVG